MGKNWRRAASFLPMGLSLVSPPTSNSKARARFPLDQDSPSAGLGFLCIYSVDRFSSYFLTVCVCRSLPSQLSTWPGLPAVLRLPTYYHTTNGRMIYNYSDVQQGSRAPMLFLLAQRLPSSSHELQCPHRKTRERLEQTWERGGGEPDRNVSLLNSLLAEFQSHFSYGPTYLALPNGRVQVGAKPDESRPAVDVTDSNCGAHRTPFLCSLFLLGFPILRFQKCHVLGSRLPEVVSCDACPALPMMRWDVEVPHPAHSICGSAEASCQPTRSLPRTAGQPTRMCWGRFSTCSTVPRHVYRHLLLPGHRPSRSL